MAKGTIPVSSIPGWPNPPVGLVEACQKSLDDAKINGMIAIMPQGMQTPDVANTQNVLNTYVGSASELTFNKNAKLQALYDLTDDKYDLRSLAVGGTSTAMSGNQVANWLANVGNNYRIKRAAINAAATVAAVNAVDINAGWPAYP